MSLNKRRTVGPILDSRTIDNPNAPKHNNLNSPRGASLEQWNTVLEEKPITMNRFVGRSQNVSRKHYNALDDKRESERLEYFTPADGDVVTTRDTTSSVIVNPAEAINALTVVLPDAPVNGQKFSLYTTQDIMDLTVTASFAPGNVPPVGMSAGIPL